MNRHGTAAAVVALALLAACARGDSPGARTMVPGGCSRPDYTADPPGQGVVMARRGMTVGVTFHRGMANYAVDRVSLRMLPAETSVGLSSQTIESTPALLSLDAGPFEAGERPVTLAFDGVDARGVPLPPGRYPVFVLVDTHNAGTCRYRRPSHVSGLVTVLDWRG